jgi:hypothetical protein
MFNLSRATSTRAPRVAAGVAAGLILVGACASAPPAPTASLQAAKTAIETAEKADAARHAAVELSEARKHLASADAAVTEEKMPKADRFARESRAQAELASAKTAAAKANAVNDEMRRSTETLIEEMKRTSGDRS